MISFSLVTAGIVQVLCQFFKLVFYSIRDRKLNLKYLVTAGGTPSAHSAFVTSLATAVGLRSGFTSDIFAVAFVLAAIVIYDAYRLRGAVQKHAVLLNRLTRKYMPEENSPLNEMLGHSLQEIVLGVALGAGFSGLVTMVLMSMGY